MQVEVPTEEVTTNSIGDDINLPYKIQNLQTVVGVFTNDSATHQILYKDRHDGEKSSDDVTTKSHLSKIS